MNKKINTDNLDSFFSFVSKAVIVIPIFILIISLFLKFGQLKKSTTSSNDIYEGRSRPTPTIVAKNNSFKFDLKGPIICDNLFIQNKKISFKNKRINYLLNGDCLYTWETGKFNGEKKCGLSSYVNLAETYLGFMSVDDLINNNIVKDKIKNKDIDLAKVIGSCKREKIKDKTIFEIPNRIIFTQ
ncbi:MAG: hypothetical protein AAB441_04660 [Patescibacteria group bacterium]